MFDTIVFQKPIYCQCGEKIESTQTKIFDNCLAMYRVGDLIDGAPFMAIEEEDFWCSKCNKREPIFIAINYQIYLGVFRDIMEAKREVDSFDMMQLWRTYVQKNQKNYTLFGESSTGFLRELKKVMQGEEEKEERFQLFNHYAEYFENTQNPTEAIDRFLNRHITADTIRSFYAQNCEFEIGYFKKDEKIFVTNNRVQKKLEREYLFEVVSADEQNLDEQMHLKVESEPTASRIVQEVQNWIDSYHIPLKVVLQDLKEIDAKEAFLDELIAIYNRYGYSLAHEDTHGAFKIDSLNAENIEWLKECLELEKRSINKKINKE